MHHRSKINVLTHSFLGTFISRNADYGGYWLHGFLARYTTIPVVNLLQTTYAVSHDPVIEFAHQLASETFRALAAKLNVLKYIKSAELTISREPASQEIWTLARPRQGYKLIFTAIVVDDRGQRYERTNNVVAAIHDPVCEIRRSRSFSGKDYSQ